MITASVVIFNSKQEELSKLLQSIENANCVERLFVIDNNACDENKHFLKRCHSTHKLNISLTKIQATVQVITLHYTKQLK